MTFYQLEAGHLFRFVGQEEYHIKLGYSDYHVAIDCQTWSTYWTSEDKLVEDLGYAKIGIPNETLQRP